MAGFVFDLNLLPYPAQVAILGNLDCSTDDILNLILAFPEGTLEATANVTKAEWVFGKMSPLLLPPHLELQDFLRCRLVCGRWKRAVDAVLENVGLAEPDYSQVNSMDDNIQDWSKHPFGLRHAWNKRNGVWGVPNEPKLLRFLQEMDAHRGNPLPFRAVSIDDGHNDEYWRSMEKFLKRFGEHIWKLNVGCYSPEAQATLTIQNLVRHTPNVRTLSLEYNGMHPHEPLEITRRVQETLFPPLPHLTSLDWSMSDVFHSYVMPQYSQQLVHLKAMDHRFMDILRIRDIGTFPSLKMLEVNVDTQAELGALTKLESPLQNLTVCAIPKIPLPVYLNVIHQFHQTLECVKIVNIEEEDDDFNEDNDYDGSEETFEFPKLVTISLERPDPLESLDELKKIQPGPKTLEIKTHSEWEAAYQGDQEPFFEEMEGELVQIHGFLDRMYESAIWEEMPQLETVKVDAIDPDGLEIQEVYSRKGKMEMENSSVKEE